MEIITESAEHHFLTTLDKLKKDPTGWYCIRLCFSRRLDYDDMIKEPAHIRGKIHKFEQQSAEWLATVKDKSGNLGKPIIYKFSDFDIVILVRAQDEKMRADVKALYQALCADFGEKLCDLSNLVKDLRVYQKLSDRKMISCKLMESYRAMSDSNKVASIDIRRLRHEDPTVLMVEDDRFTASYAANILNKDYDLILAKTGEEAIALHIEHCPDMVFLDIHLPGLSGLETLKAIKKIDANAFIYMLSVDAVKSNIVTATNDGAAGFVKKPFTKDRLLAVAEKSPYVKELKSKMKSPFLR